MNNNLKYSASSKLTETNDWICTANNLNAHLINQIPFLTNHLYVQTLVSQVECNSTNSADSSVAQLLNQKQALQRDTASVISKLSDLQAQQKYEHFLADIQLYDWKGDRSFIDMITQVEKIDNIIQCPRAKLARFKVVGILYKLIEGIPQLSTWETLKKRLCQLLSAVATE